MATRKRTTTAEVEDVPVKTTKRSTAIKSGAAAKSLVAATKKAPATKTTAVATKKTAVAVKEEPKKISLLAEIINDKLDSLEKQFSLHGTQVNDFTVRQSTGLLALNLALMGGLRPGSWNTFFGGEQSAKSTLSQMVLSEVAREDLIPIKAIFDYEGSLDLQYFANMRGISNKVFDIIDIFGAPASGGGWNIVPKVRQYQAHSAESFFDHFHALLKFMPEKREIDGEWFEVYDQTNKQHKALVGSRYEKTLSKEYGGLWVPTDNGLAQGIAMLDSYPAMLPKNLDEEGKGGGMAAQGRMFSEQIKRVKGRMGSRRFTLMGINQIRQKPGVLYGSPEYEPGGEALKFFSDVRVRNSSRIMQGVTYDKESKLENEDAVGGGFDSYRYVQMTTVKNKLGGIPNTKCWVRVWVSDNTGTARGFDPAFDTFQFLKMCGKITGTKNKLRILLPEFNEGQHKVLNWLDFKTLCLGDRAQITEICQFIGVRPMHLRVACQRHMRAGTAHDWYSAAIRGFNAEDDADPEAVDENEEEEATEE